MCHAIPVGSSVGWVKGSDGSNCDSVCSAVGSTCNSAMQSILTSNELVADAFAQAGYTCLGFHGARDYAGAPFSTGRNPDDCAPITAGGTLSSCASNPNGNHAPLCYCGESPTAWTKVGDGYCYAGGDEEAGDASLDACQAECASSATCLYFSAMGDGTENVDCMLYHSNDECPGATGVGTLAGGLPYETFAKPSSVGQHPYADLDTGKSCCT